MFEVYTDGSCLGNPGPGGIGIVILKDGEILERIAFGDPDTTNNRMELFAGIVGINKVRDEYSSTDKILLYTDSQYMISGITQWIEGWKKKNYKSVKNAEYWKMLDSIKDNVEFIKVKAHEDDFYNNMADALATRASAVIKNKGM